MSFSYTTTETFTRSDARRLGAKVAADMHQCQLKYGEPSDAEIGNFQQELEVLLLGGYVESYEFGYQTSDEKRVVTWRYKPGPAGDLEGGRSGGLYLHADTSNASMFNLLSRSSTWFALSREEQAKIDALHPVDRTTGSGPSDGNGYWSTTRIYVSGTGAIKREEFRPW